MKCILDESVSYGLAEVLRSKGYSVTAIAESSTTGIADTEVFKLVAADCAVLIARDAHFTNAVRFPSEKQGGSSISGGVIYPLPKKLILSRSSCPGTQLKSITENL